MDTIFNGMRAVGVPSATWRTSSHGGRQRNRVEVAELPDGDVALRNSHDPEGPALVYTRAEMEAFAAGVKNGEFDWIDDHAATPGAPASPSDNEPARQHQLVDDELQRISDTVLSGEAVLDRAAAERLLRVLGAVVSLHRTHDVDEHGHCTTCGPKSWVPWRRSKEDTCSVHNTLRTHLGHAFTSSPFRDR